MRAMVRSYWIFFMLVLLTGSQLVAQDDVLLSDQLRRKLVAPDAEAALTLLVYDRFNPILGADSIRNCANRPCSGWVVDKYADGKLKHRGFYENGYLLHYKNYYDNGMIERDFKTINEHLSMLRVYYRNGVLRAETRFLDGVSVEYHDFHSNGRLRSYEQRHPIQSYHLKFEVYDPQGVPITLVTIVDRNKVEFQWKEFHPGGKLKAEGRGKYDPITNKTRRHGTWRIYDANGKFLRKEEYVLGELK